MQLVKKVLILVLALAWVPLTVHCKLETIPGLEFLVCVEYSEETPHHENDCDTDSCGVVEGGWYKSDSRPIIVPARNLVPLAFLTVLLSESDPLASRHGLAVRTVSPPELPASWQFALRTALPPRAPSFPS